MSGRRLAAGASLILGLSVALPAAAQAPASPLEDRIISVAERVVPAVAHIEAILKVNDRRTQVTGSGVIVSSDGRILTNEHVVANAEKVTVSVPGRKKKYPGRVIGTDKQTDVALVRIQPEEPLPAAHLGSRDGVRVGQWVLAIGNPYGLDGTVSLGIVSAMGRNLEIPNLLNDFIQTDAMIDRGSSGGPLVDLEGRVIGINSRGRGRGIGFTIPIDTALDVMRQLERGGIARGYLGITMQALDRELADYFGLPAATGVIVTSVVADAPASRAGLRAGDIIFEFDGRPVEAEEEEDLGGFQRLVASVAPGEKADLRILRDGKERRLSVELASQPTLDPGKYETDLGFHVREITPQLARDHRLSSEDGVWVHFVARGSPAAEAGLRMGDVVTRVEDRQVEDLEQFQRAIEAVEGHRRVLVVVRRGEETRFLLLDRRSEVEQEGAGEGPPRPH